MRKISEILQDKRLELGYSLDQVVKATKIKKDFLIAIEDGRYYDLPSESYALGFIKNYASYLGEDKDRAAALFRREYEGNKGKMLPTFSGKGKSIRRISILTPRNVVIGIVIFVIFGYIAFQYNSFLFGPRLEVTNPTDGTVVRNNVLEVSGKTDPYATILVNGEEAYVALDGTFNKNIYLFEGDRQVTIDSRNRYGKNTKKIINVKVR